MGYPSVQKGHSIPEIASQSCQRKFARRVQRSKIKLAMEDSCEKVKKAKFKKANKTFYQVFLLPQGACRLKVLVSIIDCDKLKYPDEA